MSEARTRLGERLGFVVQNIDAGRYREPSDAADEILTVLLSIYPAHRADLLAVIDEVPVRGVDSE